MPATDATSPYRRCQRTTSRERTSEIAKPRLTAMAVSRMCCSSREAMSSVWPQIHDQSTRGPWLTWARATRTTILLEEPARLQQRLVHGRPSVHGREAFAVHYPVTPTGTPDLTTDCSSSTGSGADRLLLPEHAGDGLDGQGAEQPAVLVDHQALLHSGPQHRRKRVPQRGLLVEQRLGRAGALRPDRSRLLQLLARQPARRAAVAASSPTLTVAGWSSGTSRTRDRESRLRPRSAPTKRAT